MAEASVEELVNMSVDSLRKTKVGCGLDIENEMYRRALERSLNPQVTFSESGEEFVDKSFASRTADTRGINQDYANERYRNYEIADGLDNLAGRARQSVMADWQASEAAYVDLDFSDGSTIGHLATNPKEKSYLEDAAGLLGYKIEPTDGDNFTATLKPLRNPGYAEGTISTRINVGLKSLDDQVNGYTMPRPIRRAVASLALHMATALRASAHK